MKLSAMLCTSVLALAALAPAADGAINLNSSRSNIYRLAPNDANADKACTDKGGIVSTAKDGNKTCTIPVACATTIKGSKSNASFKIDTNDAAAVKECFDACGTISTDKDGNKVCTKPAPVTPSPAPSTGREPNN